MVSLPFEILSLILVELWETDLLQCALVDRTWTSISRSLVFRTMTFYPTKPSLVKRFLRLCDSPHETFSKADIRALNVSHYLTVTKRTGDKPDQLPLNRLLTWRSSDGRRTISAVFPRLRKLLFYWIDWAALTEEAKRSLSAGFKEVTDLEFYNTTFQQYDEFSTLLHAFPVLRSLEMTECKGPLLGSECPSTEVFANSGSGGHAKLENISLRRMRDARIIQLLVPSPALKSFTWWHQYSFLDLEQEGEYFTQVLQMMHQILLTATSSLEELGLYFGSYYHDSVSPSLLDFLQNVDLRKHEHLRNLELSVHPDCIVPFLKRIADVDHNHDAGPLKVLKIPSLPALDIDWYGLDKVLQSTYFKSLAELRCDFPCSFSPEDVTEQPKALWYDQPDRTSTAEIDLQERVEQFKQHLPMCEERGMLLPRIDYWYVPRWWDELDLLILPPLTRRQKFAAAVRRVARRIKALGRVRRGLLF